MTASINVSPQCAVTAGVSPAQRSAAALKDVAVGGAPGARAFRVGLLAGAYESAARNRAPTDAQERFLKALARGDLAGIPAPGIRFKAVSEGFGAAGPPFDPPTRGSVLSRLPWSATAVPKAGLPSSPERQKRDLGARARNSWNSWFRLSRRASCSGRGEAAIRPAMSESFLESSARAKR